MKKMETAASNDPYELKLYQMFQSCDIDKCGFLDEHSLRRLCSLLELRDKGAILIENLTATDIKPRVTFELFKEALLNFLGTELDDNNIGQTEQQTVTKSTTTFKQKQSNLDDNKCTLNAHTLVLRDDVETYIESPPDSSDREVSPKLVVGTKKYGRRSRPASQIFDDLSQSDSDNDINGKHNDSHRNCDANCFTSNKLVHRSSSQTDIPGSRRRRPPPMNGNRLKRCASLPAQRNMQAFGKTMQNSPQLLKSTTTTTTTTTNHKCTQNLLIPLQQDHSSSIESIDAPICIETLASNSIVDIWERANIANARGLLLALGFDENEINVEQLNKVLDEELRSLEDDQNSAVPRALLALQSSEMATLRQTLRQLKAENKKLRTDNKDANTRIAMMASEIDERHASLEDATKKEIRLLEQKHAAIVRDLTTRMTNDRENWTNLTARLEARIKTFEQDEIKLKADLELIRKENNEMETEQQKLQKQVTELLEMNIKLNREMADLEDNNSSGRCCEEQQNRYNDVTLKPTNVDDDDDDEVLRLMEKMTALQMENTNLRDKNDELVAELENLNIELTRIKSKHKKSASVMSISITTADTSTEDIQSAEESELSGGTTGTKRRGDSPSKTRISEESPRMGKLRKYTNDITSATSAMSENSDTSGEWVALNSELQQSTDMKSCYEQTADLAVDSTITTATAADKHEKIIKLEKKITKLEEELQKAKEITADERCKELETSLEQMQRAYEDCEDYWQGKLSDERQLFEKERQIYEDEQQESDKKFTDLMEKVREYEEQFSRDGRLSPIEEKYSLEQQYADLEAEVEEIRENAKKMWEEKLKEIEILQAEIEDLRIRLGESVEILTGATELQQNNEAVKFERNDHLSAASSPISYLWHQSTIQEPAKNYNALENNMTSPPLTPSKHSNLTTSETTIFSTTQFNVDPAIIAITTTTTTSTPTPAPTPTSGTTQLPIKKPTNATITATTTTTSIGSKTQSEGEVADCETSSTGSGKSFETNSIDTSTTSGGVAAAAAGGGGGDGSGVVGVSRQTIKMHSSQENVNASSIKEELKRLKFFEISLKDQIKDLSLQRDGLVMELQQLHEAKPVLEKAYARAAHPTLIQRVNQLELRNRHLQNVIKQQQSYTETIMQQSWRQHQIELSELHNRIESQGVMIADQVQRLQNADIMIKDLYVENSHLSATIQRMEQQRARASIMQQQTQLQQQQQQQQHSNNNYNVRI